MYLLDFEPVTVPRHSWLVQWKTPEEPVHLVINVDSCLLSRHAFNQFASYQSVSRRVQMVLDSLEQINKPDKKERVVAFELAPLLVTWLTHREYNWDYPCNDRVLSYLLDMFMNLSSGYTPFSAQFHAIIYLVLFSMAERGIRSHKSFTIQPIADDQCALDQEMLDE